MKTPTRFQRILAAAMLAVLPGLALTPNASYALGEGALAAATGDSARSGTVASPVMNISGSSSAQASAIAASDPGPSQQESMSVRSDSGGSAPSSGHRSGARSGGGRSSSSSSSSSTTYSGGKGVVIDKNPIAPPPAPGPEIAFTAGWDSRYLFKGRDNIDATNDPFNEDISIWYAKATLAWQGFGFSAGYLQATEKTNPRRLPGNTEEYYSEVILGANYTLGLIADVLDLTVGYNAYIFPEDGFWGGNYQGEIFGRLTYTQLEYVKPSFIYSYFHSDTYIDLEGYFLEFRIDGSIPVFDNGTVKVVLAPYVSLGYDGIEYTGNGADWCSVETGLRIPISINDKFIITLSGNYGWDAGNDQSWFSDELYLDRVGFWGGASLTYKF